MSDDTVAYREPVQSVDGWTEEQLLRLADPDPEMESVNDPSIPRSEP